MKYYVNVKFGISNKTYYFATDDASLKIGDFVVLETIVGVEIGEITTLPRELASLKFDREIKPIIRKATEEDLTRFNTNKSLALEANNYFEQYAKELNLNMLLLGSQYTLDRTKILFTYAADDRVDFRELLKKLASSLHCRIELKQITSRERAQLIGGIGVCGLQLCCTTFLHQFEGVSVNKAKNQMLSINIPKLSGQCGKLMCCLKFEDDLYTEEKAKFPQLNSKIIYDEEEYKVSSFNIFTKVIKIVSKDNAQFLTLDEFNEIQNKNNSKSKPDVKKSFNKELSQIKYSTNSDTKNPEKIDNNSEKTPKTPTKFENSKNFKKDQGSRKDIQSRENNDKNHRDSFNKDKDKNNQNKNSYQGQKPFSKVQKESNKPQNKENTNKQIFYKNKNAKEKGKDKKAE